MLKYLPLAILAVSLPAFAQNPPAAAAPQTTVSQAKPDPLDKIVCRAEETIGSRLKKHRVCATMREWKNQADENRAEAEKLQQMGQNLPRSN